MPSPSPSLPRFRLPARPSAAVGGAILALTGALLSPGTGRLLAGGPEKPAPSAAAPSAAAPDFNRDVRPILSDKCYHCHGPDEQNRKGKLRLDTPEGAARVLKGDSPDKTEFVRRIVTADADERMPPAESNFTKRLSEKETAVLRAWVAAGAKYSRHWAFEPPAAPQPPEISDAAMKQWPAWSGPVDRFVLDRLAREGLKPSPEADRAVLLRRASLDLTGLPPTPEELDAFLKDTSPDAFGSAVDRLLASPRFGERMALWWMDLARYGDSSVYHADGPREMWGWRDWVIRAFNSNMPFDRFTVEQIAGDLLPGATADQKIASGFNRNHATTDEGGVIPEEFRVDYVVDRVKTVSNAWLALSMECGQCHDHKYDPISQRDYYRFYAFFNNTKDAGMQTRKGNAAPMVEVTDPEADAKRTAAAEARKDAAAKLAAHRAKAATAKAFTDWLAKQSAPKPLDKDAKKDDAKDAKKDDAKPAPSETPAAPATPFAPAVALFLPCDEKDNLGYVSALDGRFAAAAEGKTADAKRPGGDGLKLSGGQLFEFDEAATGATPIQIDAKTPFTFSAWVKVAAKGGGSLLTRMEKPPGHRGFDFGLEGGKPGLHLVHQWPGNALKVYAKEAVKPDAWHHVVITGDGSGKAAGIRIYVDGAAQEKQVHNDTLGATSVADTALRFGGRGYGGGKFKGEVDDVSLCLAECPPASVAEAGRDPAAVALVVAPAARTEAHTAALLGRFLRSADPAYPPLLKALGNALDAARSARAGKASVMVMEDLPAGQMRTTYILNRGQYDKPLKDKPVTPGIPAAFGELPADAPANRLGLAKWLVRPDNPLTARVAVNRLWGLFFGAGLVRTSEDFGLQGETPSHPELLDFLAVDFVRSGWDVKRMIRQIVTSAAYRQASRMGPDLRERDPENRLLARGPRFRLQGEFIRDGALYVSGLMVEKIGGPSVRPYQPTGIWEEVALDTNLSKYVQDHGERLYRRSMYTYWKRSSPHPSMMAFDAPTREKCTGMRPRTNTPIQALVTLNDPQFVEAARAFAQRIIKTAGPGASAEDRVRLAVRLALARPATDREVAVLAKLAAAQLARFAAEPKKAEEFLKIGESPRDAAIPAPEHAAWAVVASTLLNLDEFLVKN